MVSGRWHFVVRSSWQVLLPFTVFVLHSLLFRSWLIDDAGISFVYARNFVHGLGLVAQPGADPVEAISNPLWTFLIAPIFITPPTDPAPYVKALSHCLILGTFALVAEINRRLFGPSWWSGAATVATLAFVSVSTSFVVWTTSGLENPLYAFLSAVLCFQLVTYATDRGRRTAALAAYAGLASAGLALTRPDGIVFFAAFPGVLAIRAVNDPSEWRAEGRRLVAFLGAAFLPVAAYVLFRVAYFGDLFPNTFIAKGGRLREAGSLGFLKECVLRGYDLLHSMFSWGAWILLPLLLLGTLYLMFRRRKTSLVVFLLPILACSWAIYGLLPDDWMSEYRFGTPFLLLLPLVLFVLLAEALRSSRLSPRAGKMVFSAVAALVVVHSLFLYVPRSLRFARNPTVPFATIARLYAIQFNDYASELGVPGASLLCPDMGGTLYFSRLRVHDLAGLCDRKLARLINGDKAALHEYVFQELRPTFIHVHDIWSLRSRFDEDRRFRELYATIWERPLQGAPDMGLRGVYSGDYVLRTALRSEADLGRLRRTIHEGTIPTQPPGR